MAIKIPFVVERDGVLYYHRRVPKAVIDQPGALARYFKGQAVVRISLGTKDRLAAVHRAAQITKDFDERVSKALDTSAALMPRSIRPVTPEALHALGAERRRRHERQLAQYRLIQEEGGENAEIVEDLVYQIEMDAELTNAVMANRVSSEHPKHDYDAMALEAIEQEGFDAPVGSTAFSAVKLALKDADRQGISRGLAIWDGRESFLTTVSSKPRTPKLSEAVASYLERHRNKRTVEGIQEALRSFIDAVGDLRVDHLTPDHFRAFCRVQAAIDIGGRSRGSVARPTSAETIDKKLTFLRGAIKHAIDHGTFEGANPAVGITSKPFVRPADPLIMPAKRPFTTEELNRILAYPWFTGCMSATRRHERGEHRLGGMWYWGPVLALLTGCRASEVGGLLLSEIKADHQYPHLIIQNNELRTTKGGYSRKVPIIDQLVELGFLQFVEHKRKAGARRLFDDWTIPSIKPGHVDKPISNGPMVRSFNTTLLPQVLDGILSGKPGRQSRFTLSAERLRPS